MERYIDFEWELRENVKEAVKQINNSNILTKMNNVRDGNIRRFRLSIIGKENEVDFYLQQLNAILN